MIVILMASFTKASCTVDVTYLTDGNQLKGTSWCNVNEQWMGSHISVMEPRGLINIIDDWFTLNKKSTGSHMPQPLPDKA